jgi:CobQ-like glutamine amidotransferase family enzyme
MTEKKIKINHLYSKNLNIYGDLGNIIALQYRAKVHGVECEVVNTEIGDENIQEADIYFIGGGQDNDQIAVFKDLLRYQKFIGEELEKGKIFLLICGGYQLFGKFFLDSSNNLIEGLGLLDIETVAPGPEVKSRCIGNLIVEMNEGFIQNWSIDTTFSKFLVGFENHGGQTNLLSSQVQPIGKVIKGFGNNYASGFEGCMYKNLIAGYMHGSMLPKNPHLADAIIRRAAGIGFEPLEKFDVEVEKKAHEFILEKIND